MILSCPPHPIRQDRLWLMQIQPPYAEGRGRGVIKHPCLPCLPTGRRKAGDRQAAGRCCLVSPDPQKDVGIEMWRVSALGDGLSVSAFPLYVPT